MLLKKSFTTALLLTQKFVSIITISLDGVPLIAVLNTLSGVHLKIVSVRAYATGFWSACGTRQILSFVEPH